MTRLKQYLAIAIILTALAVGYAWAGQETAHVMLAGRELPLSPLPVVDDGTVYAPIELISYLGCTYSVDRESHTVTIILTSGTETQLPTVALKDHEMLSVMKVAEIVDGEVRWNPDRRIINILSRLKSVEFAGGALRVNLSLPTSYKLKFWPNPDRLALDVIGTKLAAPANEVFIGNEDIGRARLGQFDELTSRVVLDLSRRVGYKIVSEPITNKIEIQIGSGLVQSTEVTTVPSGGPVTITEVTTESMGNDRLRVSVLTEGKPSCNYLLLKDPMRLCIDMTGAKLGSNTCKEISVDHPLTDKIRLGQLESGKPEVRLVMELKRYLAYSVVSISENGLVIDVRLPQGAGGHLSDKLIVIDPGHGGPQKGTSFEGIYEKTLNLQFAKKVALRLEELGARAILTREGDYNLGPSLKKDLEKRPGVATEYGADLFISIHCNALGISSSPSGTETYYRQARPDSYVLANAVHKAILADTGMNDRGVRSDEKLHGALGLAVLRHATVPAILIETGYLDNYSDRKKMVAPDFQEKFARAIVEGLRFYVEGQTGEDTQ